MDLRRKGIRQKFFACSSQLGFPNKTGKSYIAWGQSFFNKKNQNLYKTLRRETKMTAKAYMGSILQHIIAVHALILDLKLSHIVTIVLYADAPVAYAEQLMLIAHPG
jgi:hypothetical protein